MAKAIALLKIEGVISGVEKGSLYAGSDRTRPPAPPAEKQKKWARLAARFERDILFGKLADKQILPPVKTLCFEYGIAPQTLRKMLDHAESKGLISSDKTRYRIKTSKIGYTHDSIVLIMPASSVDELNIQYARAPQIVAALERECANRRLKLVPIGFTQSDPLFFDKMRRRLKAEKNIIGFIWDAWWYSMTGEPFPIEIDLFKVLSGYKRPLVIIDENASFPDRKILFPGPNVRIFTVGGREAGAGVARQLLLKGHGRAAYLSHYHGSTWSQLRLAGLEGVYREMEGQCQIFTRDSVTEAFQVIFAVSRATHKDFQTVYDRIPLSPERRREIEARFLAAQSNPFGLSYDSEPARAIATIFSDLVKIAGVISDARMFLTNTNAMVMAMREYAAQLTLEPLLEQALRENRSTVWVCSNDSVAINAKRFLKRNSRDIPADISLASIDNSEIAMGNRIASYDFNMSGIVSWAVQFFLQDHRFKRAEQKRMEIEGSIIERESLVIVR
jgi:DNA-binding LacI/PurR family transcriptional regulator